MSQSEKPDHTRTPILDGIKNYLAARTLSFTVPGHKCGHGAAPETMAVLGEEVFRNDIPMLNGVDDRRESKGAQSQAEQLAADAYHAEESFFSTNGTSLSAHVAMYAVAGPGDEVLMARNGHKSVIAAAILAHVRPVFLHPAIDDEWDVEHGVTPEHLTATLDQHPGAKAVFVVSPNYYGVTSDLRTLAEICHARGVPLIVDEAWGPHFPFHPDLPPSGMESGADISVGSIHKTLTGLGQASIINKQGSLVPSDRLTLSFDLFESTSPSSLIMGSIDGSRRQMVLHGRELWGRALALSSRARAALAEIPGIQVMGREVLQKPGTAQLDETKITLDIRGLGVSGFEAADWLLERFHLTLELADHRHLMAILTVADDENSADRFVEAIRALVAWARERPRQEVPCLPHHRELTTELVMPPGQAFVAPVEHIPLEKAAGRIAAEMMSPYPPGIPRLVPGERFTPAIIEYLRKGLEAGMYVPDASDTSLKTVRVVA